MIGSRLRIASLALVVACTGPRTDTSSSPPTGETGNVLETDTNGLGSGHFPQCPMLGAAGSFVAVDRLGPGSFDLAMTIAVAASGDIAVVRNGAGVTVLSPDLRPKFEFAFGSFVAFDASGNLFVAGEFTQPTDFGLGTIAPNGNVDTFLVELDRDGNVIAANSLGLCGSGLASMAIDSRTGHVALSGSALGTVVLDTSGHALFSFGFSGHVAFDAQGNLVVAGSFAQIDFGSGVIVAQGSADAFVAKIDCNGNIAMTKIVSATGSVDVRALAVGPSNEIVFGGNFSGTIDLFGTRAASVAGEIIQFDTFLAKLDADGNVVFVNPPTQARDINAIAIDVLGNIVVAGDNASGREFGRLTGVVKLAPDGSVIFNDNDAFPIDLGEGLAVAVNRCGAIFLGALTVEPISAGGAMDAVLFEIAP